MPQRSPLLPQIVSSALIRSLALLSPLVLASGCYEYDYDYEDPADMDDMDGEPGPPGVGFIADPDVGSSNDREDRPCDPIDQDCGSSLGCYWIEGEFLCADDFSGDVLGALGDACEYANSCDPGLYCADGHLVEGCDTSGCCSQFCDLDDTATESACPDRDQECMPWWDEGQAPVGYERVGACVLRS